MATETFNSEAKILIRSKWSKEIIKFISDNLKIKLVYLGLPSPAAEDILEWIDYINEVIAFQCREYPKPSDPSQDREEIIRLEQKLEGLERQQKIDNFQVYDGYMEEVLTNRKDNMNIEFIQNDVIHIYNLDFCNEIKYPREVLNENGDIVEVHKFDAVKNLLEGQAEIDSSVQRFILFLTINAKFKSDNLSEYIKNRSDQDIQKYLKSINNIRQLDTKEKNIRFLRTYVLESLSEHFANSNFEIDILPTIRYEGISGHKMLHFTVFGTKNNDSEVSINKIKEFLSNKFITIENNDFINLSLDTLNDENNNLTCPVDCFKTTNTYNNLWK
ncbi:MAG: hypothetical protein DRG78_06380 [Epsilonproteobacteria bacterium]|nr:MAG: hypothetical protein DRG78_06380 [Campylobacterota bacterium]